MKQTLFWYVCLHCKTVTWNNGIEVQKHDHEGSAYDLVIFKTLEEAHKYIDSPTEPPPAI